MTEQAEKWRDVQERLRTGAPFTADDLYFATAKCPCGARLAYPLDVNPFLGYWDCSEILMGSADRAVMHTAKLPFPFYKVK